MTLGLDCCCGGKSCTLFKDNFDRVAIGNGYTTSNITINSGRLTGAALGPYSAIALYSTVDVKMVVEANLSFTSGSLFTERAGIIVNYKDANNYLFVEVEATFSTFAGTVQTRLFFYRRSGGVNTQLGTTKTLDSTKGIANLGVRVCYDGVNLKAFGYSEAATPIDGGFRAGMYSSSSSSSVFFDDFKISRNEIGCPNCSQPTKCGDCWRTYPKTEFLFDLGVGGLTNSIWNQATFLSGVFILNYVPAGTVQFIPGWFKCLDWWDFSPGPACGYIYTRSGPGTTTYGAPCSRNGVPWVTMSLEQRLTAANTLGWAVWINVCETVVECGGFNFNRNMYAALYTGGLTTYGDCAQTPVTLNKVAETINSYAGSPFVNGTLPSSAELRIPA